MAVSQVLHAAQSLLAVSSNSTGGTEAWKQAADTLSAELAAMLPSQDKERAQDLVRKMRCNFKANTVGSWRPYVRCIIDGFKEGVWRQVKRKLHGSGASTLQQCFAKQQKTETSTGQDSARNESCHASASSHVGGDADRRQVDHANDFGFDNEPPWEESDSDAQSDAASSYHSCVERQTADEPACCFPDVVDRVLYYHRCGMASRQICQAADISSDIQEDIQKQWRKVSRQLHPDKKQCKEDKDRATQAFIIVKSAVDEYIKWLGGTSM